MENCQYMNDDALAVPIAFMMLPANLWRSLGYDVVRLGDFHAFAVNLGAVHCIKKYLERT